MSDKELQDAKDFITGNFATRFGSSGRIANYILAVEILGFSPGYADEYLKKIRRRHEGANPRGGEKIHQTR